MYNYSDDHKLSDANISTLVYLTKAISEALSYGAQVFESISITLQEHLRFQKSLRQHGKVLRIEDLIKELDKMDSKLARELERCEIIRFDLGRLWIKERKFCMHDEEGFNSFCANEVSIWLAKEKIVEALEACYKCKFKVRVIKDKEA